MKNASMSALSVSLVLLPRVPGGAVLSFFPFFTILCLSHPYLCKDSKFTQFNPAFVVYTAQFSTAKFICREAKELKKELKTGFCQKLVYNIYCLFFIQ